MEAVLIAASAAGVLLLGLVWLWPMIRARARERRSTLELLARKLKGTLKPSWLGGKELELEVDGIPARLRIRAETRDDPGWTLLRFHAPQAGRLRAVPEGPWQRLLKSFGAEDLELGDPAFDRDYVVQGAPREWALRVLDPELRARVARLRLTLEAGPAGIFVRMPECLIDHRERLESFLRGAVEIFRAVRSSEAPGDSVQDLARAGRCPVCGHPLGERPRRCDACATPHHADCWAYFGGCSTYACRENP